MAILGEGAVCSWNGRCCPWRMDLVTATLFQDALCQPPTMGSYWSAEADVSKACAVQGVCACCVMTLPPSVAIVHRHGARLTPSLFQRTAVRALRWLSVGIRCSRLGWVHWHTAEKASHGMPSSVFHALLMCAPLCTGVEHVKLGCFWGNAVSNMHDFWHLVSFYVWRVKLISHVRFHTFKLVSMLAPVNKCRIQEWASILRPLCFCGMTYLKWH